MLSHCFAKRLRTCGGSQALELIFVCCDYYAELLCFKFCAKKIRIYYNGKRIHDSALIRKLKLNGFYISGELKSIRLVFLSRDVLTLRLLQECFFMLPGYPTFLLQMNSMLHDRSKTALIFFLFNRTWLLKQCYGFI